MVPAEILLAARNPPPYADLMRLSSILTTFANRSVPVIVALISILTPVLAWAQTPGAPPQPSIKRSPPAWIGMIVMFVLLAMVVFVSLMPSKRSHQD
jgi:hypothetical protein